MHERRGVGGAVRASRTWIVWGFSLMAVARSFCDIFLAMRACMMSFFVSVDTLACVRVSVSFSRRDIWAECAERLPPAPYFFIVSVGRPAALAAAPDMRDVFVLFLLIFCSLCGNGIKNRRG